MNDSRALELEANLAAVESRIAVACAAAGRARDAVTLVVVTKHFPADDVRRLAALGVRHVAENKHQEASEKHASCSDLGLTWHYVGHLQSNKASAVAGWADVVQSVDRVGLLAKLARGAQVKGEPVEVLIQVSLDEPGTTGRSGAPVQDVPALVQAAAAQEDLVLAGVMGVAPRGGDPVAAFEELSRVAELVRAAAPRADWISAGMSGDLEAAVTCGATHVRVGTAVLGNRPVRG